MKVVDVGDGRNLHDNSRINCDFDWTTIQVFADCKRLVSLVVVAMIFFKELTTGNQCSLDFLLLRVKLQWEDLKIFNLLGASERTDVVGFAGITEFLAIPVYSASSGTETRTKDRLGVATRSETSCAVLSPLFAVYGAARRKDHEEMLISDDLVLDIVIPGGEEVFKFLLQCIVEKLKMCLGDWIFLITESLLEFSPSMNERMERRRKLQSVQ
jgi:hypothetical protein